MRRFGMFWRFLKKCEQFLYRQRQIDTVLKNNDIDVQTCKILGLPIVRCDLAKILYIDWLVKLTLWRFAGRKLIVPQKVWHFDQWGVHVAGHNWFKTYMCWTQQQTILKCLVQVNIWIYDYIQHSKGKKTCQIFIKIN